MLFLCLDNTNLNSTLCASRYGASGRLICSRSVRRTIAAVVQRDQAGKNLDKLLAPRLEPPCVPPRKHTSVSNLSTAGSCQTRHFASQRQHLIRSLRQRRAGCHSPCLSRCPYCAFDV